MLQLQYEEFKRGDRDDADELQRRWVALKKLSLDDRSAFEMLYMQTELTRFIDALQPDADAKIESVKSEKVFAAESWRMELQSRSMKICFVHWRSDARKRLEWSGDPELDVTFIVVQSPSGDFKVCGKEFGTAARLFISTFLNKVNESLLTEGISYFFCESLKEVLIPILFDDWKLVEAWNTVRVKLSAAELMPSEILSLRRMNVYKRRLLLVFCVGPSAPLKWDHTNDEITDALGKTLSWDPLAFDVHVREPFSRIPRAKCLVSIPSPSNKTGPREEATRVANQWAAHLIGYTEPDLRRSPIYTVEEWDRCQLEDIVLFTRGRDSEGLDDLRITQWQSIARRARYQPNAKSMAALLDGSSIDALTSLLNMQLDGGREMVVFEYPGILAFQRRVELPVTSRVW